MSLEDLEKASAEIDVHVPEYVRARRYYDGDEDVDYINGLFQKVMDDRDFTGTLNYASIPVDAVADRCQLLSIKGPNKQIDEMIEQIHTSNKMPIRFSQFVLDVLKYGEYYISVWPEDIEDLDSEPTEAFDTDRPAAFLESTPVNHRAKMMFADPETTRAFYDDGGELMFTARKWTQKNENDEDIVRVNLYYNDFIEKYWWLTKHTVSRAQEWFDDGQTEWPMENPYGQNPIFHFQTAFPHGTPEHKALYGVQDAMNKIFQTHIASIEFLGFPIIYTLLGEDNAEGASQFEASHIDKQEASIDTSGISTEPGSFLALRANSVGQIEPAGSANFIESLKQYKEIASELSGLPARLFSSTDGQHPGADAVNAADAVLRQRVLDRELLLGEALKLVISFALKLAFGVEVAPEDIVVLWRPQKIELDADMIAVFEFKLRLGIPVRQILSEMGYTAVEINDFIGEGPGKVLPEPGVIEKLPGDSSQNANENSVT